MKTQKTTATIFGALLTLGGIGGFFIDAAPFSLNVVHNLVHILSGLAGLLCGLAAGGKWARHYNLGFGAVYLAVAILGVLGVAQAVALLGLNYADNWLHLVVSVLLLGVGYYGKK